MGITTIRRLVQLRRRIPLRWRLRLLHRVLNFRTFRFGLTPLILGVVDLAGVARAEAQTPAPARIGVVRVVRRIPAPLPARQILLPERQTAALRAAVEILLREVAGPGERLMTAASGMCLGVMWG